MVKNREKNGNIEEKFFNYEKFAKISRVNNKPTYFIISSRGFGKSNYIYEECKRKNIIIIRKVRFNG